MDLINLILVLFQLSIFVIAFAVMSNITENIHHTKRVYIPIQWKLPCRVLYLKSERVLTRDKLSLMFLHEIVNNKKRVVFEIANLIRVDKGFTFEVFFLYIGFMLTMVKLIRMSERYHFIESVKF